MRKFLSLSSVLVMCSLLAFSQVKPVTGKVTDAQGQPVPYPSIRIKGSKIGVSGDVDGSFSIKANSGQTLIISGTGIEVKEVPVGTGIPLLIQVNRKESSLTEVVVTALGIQRQEKELGYSTQKVTAKELTVAQPISVANGLTGKVSGLEIQTVNNGVFAPTRITLRGDRSLTGNNQPLIVVDGAIFYNDISTLNPQDIQDVTILKGSSASAVYGSDASNGVMLITTKHGTRGKPVVTFSTTQQLETVAYLPKYQEEFGSNGGEAYVYDFNNLTAYIPLENQSYGPFFNGQIAPVGRILEDGDLLQVPYAAVPNQKRDFFNKGWTGQTNFSYSAGDENSRFFLSGQDIGTSGIMPYDNGKRDVLRVGGSRTYGIFSANFSLSYTYKYSNLGNTGSIYDNLMSIPAQIPITQFRNFNTNEFATPDGYFNDFFQNPYELAATQRNKTTDNNLTGNIQLNLRPAKWLNFSKHINRKRK